MQKLKIAALLVLLIMFNVAATGCLSDDTKKEPKLNLTLIGSAHKIYAGETTTYLVLVENNMDENDSISLGIKSAPSGWDVTLNQTSFNLTAESSLGIFVVVKAKDNAKSDKYKVKIEALSDVFGSKKSLTITTKVISDSGRKGILGDKVAINYFGYLEEFQVFDTSIEKIGTNWDINKKPGFSPRASKDYKPLLVYVGPDDPDTKDDYGSVVEGFWEAIVGMRESQSRTVVIPQEKAYAHYVNATMNITEEVVMTETLTLVEFEEKYPLEELHQGMTMDHEFWGWKVRVDYFNETEDVVRLINEPNINEIITPYGWTSKVTYKNQGDLGGEGRIIVTHEPEEGDEGEYLSYPAIVDKVEGDIFYFRYNDSSHDLGRRTLIFDITLESIKG